MPVMDRIKDRFTNDPKFVSSEDLLLAMECLSFCMVHQIDHQRPALCVWLSDAQYEQYLALYPEPPKDDKGNLAPTFFGLAVKPNKSA